MNRCIVIAGLALALSLHATLDLVAQEGEGSPEDRIEILIDRLGHEDFNVRDTATNELIEIGEPALAALRRAAESDDPERSWRAQKTLDRIEAALAERRNDAPEGQPAPPRSRGGFEGVLPPDEELFRVLPGNEEFRKILEESLRRAFEDFDGNDPGREGLRLFFRDFGGSGIRKRVIRNDQGEFTFETEPDGSIRGQVVRREGGEEVVREFSFENEEEMREKDPELHRFYEGSGSRGFDMQRGPFSFRFRMEGLDDLERQFDPDRSEEPRRQSTRPPAVEEPLDESYEGLSVREVEPVLRAQLDLPEGVGLMVSAVEPGSAAGRYGFEAWDLVLSANGAPIFSLGDYRSALESLAEGEGVVFEIVRRGQAMELTAAR